MGNALGGTEVINGYQFYVPTTGGKAGKGRNKTGTVQVRKDGFIKKQFRFKTNDRASSAKAFKKARDWMEAN